MKNHLLVLRHNIIPASCRMLKWCLLLLALCWCAMPACAEDWSFSDVKEHPRSFITGLAAGVLFHEMGHVAVATAKGYDVGLDKLTIVYPHANMSKSDHLEVASAGFQAQWLMSEAVLRSQERSRGKHKLTNTEAGLVCAHLLITTAYLTVLKDHAGGDVVGISESSGLSHDKVAALIAIPAALDYWRLTGHHVPTWVPMLSVTAKGIGIGKIWKL